MFYNMFFVFYYVKLRLLEIKVLFLLIETILMCLSILLIYD